MQNQCPRDDYSKIDYLMQCVETPINVFQFYSEDLSSHEILKQQKGTTRTNCLDCLDRTNVIQTRISWLVLQKMLYYLNLNVKNIFDKSEKFFYLTDNKFKENFKDLWAENGDQISIQYAGTASTITTVTKTGGHNLMGLIQHGIATVSRIYQGSFEDYFKQECIDTFLQKNLAEDFVNPVIYGELRKKKEEFTKYMDFFIYVGNWNLAGKQLDNDIDIINWLNAFKDNNLCPEETEDENQKINFFEKFNFAIKDDINLDNYVKKFDKVIQEGKELPDFGACKHYKHSLRWFRFSCCNKIFPCDICHDESSDHNSEYAKTVLCGFCACEQSSSNKICQKCGKMFTKSEGGKKFWEGGKGCRDPKFMNARDSHKFTGLNKTISRRQQRKNQNQNNQNNQNKKK
jgi:uncharacterized CHY-type Zn-finger protein